MTTTHTAYVEVRSQSPKGQWPRQGPDTYVAVQIVPDGVARLKYLNQVVAEKRGIEIRYFGEGYSNRTGPRSSLGRAIEEAREFAATVNGDRLATESSTE